jgi:hypothetical protein
MAAEVPHMPEPVRRDERKADEELSGRTLLTDSARRKGMAELKLQSDIECLTVRVS